MKDARRSTTGTGLSARVHGPRIRSYDKGSANKELERDRSRLRTGQAGRCVKQRPALFQRGGPRAGFGRSPRQEAGRVGDARGKRELELVRRIEAEVWIVVGVAGEQGLPAAAHQGEIAAELPASLGCPMVAERERLVVIELRGRRPDHAP